MLERIQVMMIMMMMMMMTMNVRKPRWRGRSWKRAAASLVPCISPSSNFDRPSTPSAATRQRTTGNSQRHPPGVVLYLFHSEMNHTLASAISSNRQKRAWSDEGQKYGIENAAATNICAKFHWNPSTKYRDIASREICVNGWAVLPLPLPLPSGWTTSSADAFSQSWPNAQPRRNQKVR